MRVDALHDGAIPFDEAGGVHAGDEVEVAGDVVACTGVEDAPFAAQAAEELGSGHGLQQTHHCERYGALLDELDHAVEDVFAVGVEAEDEAAHDFDAVLLDAFDAV